MEKTGGPEMVDAPRSAWLDPRQVRSVCRIFSCLEDRAGQSYSAALGSGPRQAARRIFGDRRMTVNDLLSGHYAETTQRCQRHPVVLVAQDTTELDYKGHEKSKTELGPMAGPKSWGMLSHEALALTESGEPLGLLAVELWRRDPQEAGSRHARHKRSPGSKESAKWGRTLAAIQERLGETPQAVVLSDRESDVYAYLSEPRRAGVDLVLRARHPRRVELADGGSETRTLFEALREASVMGYLELETCREGRRRPERVRLLVSVLKVDVVRPAGVPSGSCPSRVGCCAIWVREEKAPSQGKAIQWYLLTTLSVETVEAANRVVGYYGRRWRIETFHKTLKTGIGVEDLQIPDAHSLRNAVAAHYVAAWRVMGLTYGARTTPEAPARELLTEEELTVLQAVSGKTIQTAHQALIEVAKLGGYEHYRKAAPPGPLRVWVGLQRLAAMIIGYRAAIYDTR